MTRAALLALALATTACAPAPRPPLPEPPAVPCSTLCVSDPLAADLRRCGCRELCTHGLCDAARTMRDLDRLYAHALRLEARAGACLIGVEDLQWRVQKARGR